MRSLPNIEKSVIRPGEYNGWNTKGESYRIRKDGTWFVTYAPGASCSRPTSYPSARTLTELSMKLGNLR